MGAIGRVLRVSLLGAAALLTPLAGTAHVDCLCPNGHVKLFCLDILSGARACCCGGSCCDRLPPGAPGKVAPCCHHARRPGSERAGRRLAGTPCKKTLAEGRLQSVPPTESAGPARPAVAALAVARLPTPSAVPPGADHLHPWHPYHLPPPPDLLTNLRHLLI